MLGVSEESVRLPLGGRRQDHRSRDEDKGHFMLTRERQETGYITMFLNLFRGGAGQRDHIGLSRTNTPLIYVACKVCGVYEGCVEWGYSSLNLYYLYFVYLEFRVAFAVYTLKVVLVLPVHGRPPHWIGNAKQVTLSYYHCIAIHFEYTHTVCSHVVSKPKLRAWKKNTYFGIFL